MIHSNFICLAIALLVLAVGQADVIRKPEAPISIAFAQGHINAALRAARSEKFNGTFKGTEYMFGITGTHDGKFSGESKDKKSIGDVTGKARGDVDMFGTKGRYSSEFTGNFRSYVNGKKYRLKYKGDFDFEYRGMYAGKEHYGKAIGSYSGDIRNGKLVMKERGKVNVRVAGKVIKGNYAGVYDGETIGMKMTGTMDGKKFKVRWQFMLEDMEKLIKHEGTYEVVCNGKKSSGKYSGWDMIPSK